MLGHTRGVNGFDSAAAWVTGAAGEDVVDLIVPFDYLKALASSILRVVGNSSAGVNHRKKNWSNHTAESPTFSVSVDTLIREKFAWEIRRFGFQSRSPNPRQPPPPQEPVPPPRPPPQGLVLRHLTFRSRRGRRKGKQEHHGRY